MHILSRRYQSSLWPHCGTVAVSAVNLSYEYACASRSVLKVNQQKYHQHGLDHDKEHSDWTKSCSGSQNESQFGRQKPLPEISLKGFFVRGNSISQVVNLLKNNPWDDALQTALKTLQVTFDTLFVTQVLRVDIPCDVGLSFFHWLKSEQRFSHNEFTYTVMLNTLGRLGHLKEMQELFEEMQLSGCAVSRVALSTVMLWFLQANDMKRVSLHWDNLQHSGVKPSVAMYTAYIEFLVRMKRYAEIAATFEEMLTVGCLPNSRTYAVFVKYLMDGGNVGKAAKILKLMQSIRVVPNRLSYNMVINGFAKIQNTEMTLYFLSEMREHFHMPSKQLLPAARALQQAGKAKEAAKLLEEMETDLPYSSYDVDDSHDGMTVWRNVTCLYPGFDVNVFTQSLYTWNHKVEEVLEHANMQWSRPLVIEILRRLRNFESIWGFFQWLKHKTGFKHDSYTCALVIQRILKSRCTLGKKDSLVRELFQGLQNDGMSFTVPMFNLVIRYYLSIGEAEKASLMLDMIKDFGLEPNAFSYSLVVQAFARNGQVKKATLLLKEIEELGFPVDSETSAEVIECLGLSGKTEKALALFHKRLISDKYPGPLEYKAIITAYAKSGDNGMALKMYEDMKRAGINPTQDMFELVTGVLRKAKRYSEIHVLVDERNHFDFFDGNNKVLQENLMQILFLFLEGLKSTKLQGDC